MEPSENALSLVKALDEILRRVIVGFEDAGVELPERKYWTLSTPAADCEQLVLSFNQLYIGPVGDEASEPQRCNSPRTAQLSIQILRSIPGPEGTRAKMPSPEKIQKASEKMAIDAWVLLDLACELDVWESVPHMPGLGVIATVDAGEAQGGYQGPTLNLTLAIP